MSHLPVGAQDERKLLPFAGRWIGSETLAPSPWSAAGMASSFVTARMHRGDRMLIQDYVQEQRGRRVQRVHAVIVLGDFGNQVNLYWFDALGAPPVPAPGYWEGELLVFTRATARGNMRHAYTLGGDNSYTCRLEGSLDGGRSWTAISQGKYLRIPP